VDFLLVLIELFC